MSIAKKLLCEGEGIYRLTPTWVPRTEPLVMLKHFARKPDLARDFGDTLA